MQTQLAEIYCGCMEDVKARLALVRGVLAERISTGSESFNYEVVAIQLRKSLELVAFASMTANQELYARAHAGFADHWKAKAMLNSLERMHPGFYPQPIRLAQSKDAGVKHFKPVKEGFLTKDEFVALYDACSDTLHTWNPFTSRPRRITFGRSVTEWVQRIEQLLRVHQMRFVDRQEIWVVDMEYPGDGKVHAFIAAPSSAV